MPETDIFRLLDADLRPLVAPEGLMLARPIADRLGLARDDVLVAEVLERKCGSRVSGARLLRSSPQPNAPRSAQSFSDASS